MNDAPLRAAVASRASDAGTPEDAAAAIDAVDELKLPVGWGANAPDNIFAAIPGWVIAIAALNLGAPFWFDLLSRLARLRGSGVQAPPRSLSDTAATVEREPIAIAVTEAPEGEAEPGTEDDPPPREKA